MVALAAGLAGATAIASIAAEHAPSFRGGGMIPAMTSIAPTNPLPDARNVSVEPEEAIMNRAGVQAAGGKEGIDRLNAGLSAGTTVVNLNLKHETIAKAVNSHLNRPSQMRAMINGTPGQRARR